jgi:hypothetical protein
MARMPADMTRNITLMLPGVAHNESTDSDAFDCRNAPAFFLTSSDWSYTDYTWHTNRDTYDKIVFDDLKSNATLTAMLAYLASEDPTLITRERVDLAALAQQAQAQAQAQPAVPNAARGGGGGGRGGRGFPTTWPQCTKAPRSTDPRLK